MDSNYSLSVAEEEEKEGENQPAAMTDPIRVGDLVIVVADNGCRCAAESKTIGHIFRISGIEVTQTFCTSCFRSISAAPCASGHSGELVFCLNRLKRIPPLGELEHEKIEAGVTIER